MTTNEDKNQTTNGGPKVNKSSTTNLVGQTIGDYLILRRLGQGGMAEVYLAEQLSLKRKVAIKVLKPELASNRGYVDRFVREAQAAAALVQANIVQIYEVGQRNGVHFIAQEYIAGRNLRQYLTRHGAMAPAMAVNILRQAAMALQKAAEQGVIHRDIKPENIMISTAGEVKVTDFGLARIVNDEQRLNLTQIGMTMGTPLYMSPEQVQGHAVDPRSDIYSLGVTAWQMLAGHPPFTGENALAVALQQINSPPPDLRAIRPDAPPQLIALIERMMAKAPDDRVQSATELLRELRGVRVEQPENWDELVESIVTGESWDDGARGSTKKSRLAATQRLQQVMEGRLPASPRWRRVLVGSLLSMVAIAAGVVMGMYRPIPDPLSETETPLAFIAKKESAEAQYREAQWVGLPEFYLAVLEYFPPEQASADARYTTKLYNYLAMQRLGEMYLQMAEPDYEQAFRYFSELAEVEDAFVEFRAAGLVGMAIVADHYRDDIHLIGYVMQAAQYRELLNEFLRGWLDRLIEALQNRSRRGLFDHWLGRPLGRLTGIEPSFGLPIQRFLTSR